MIDLIWWSHTSAFIESRHDKIIRSCPCVTSQNKFSLQSNVYLSFHQLEVWSWSLILTGQILNKSQYQPCILVCSCSQHGSVLVDGPIREAVLFVLSPHSGCSLQWGVWAFLFDPSSRFSQRLSVQQLQQPQIFHCLFLSQRLSARLSVTSLYSSNGVFCVC